MATNDEIIVEVNNERRKQQIRGAMLTLPTDPRAENYKDLIKAMDKARADERKQTVKEIFSFLDEYADIMEHAGYQGVKRKFLNE